jgi:uncharacterized membrane protein YhaH (DUF805 family)
MFLPYRRYAQFGGRAQRMEFWMFNLFTTVANLALDLALGGDFAVVWGLRPTAAPIAGIVGGLFALASFVPSLAVTVRRLHDTDRSRWWLLLALVPVLGWIALLIFLCMDGMPGPNRFGDDPKGRGLAQVFS